MPAHALLVLERLLVPVLEGDPLPCRRRVEPHPLEALGHGVLLEGVGGGHLELAGPTQLDRAAHVVKQIGFPVLG